jgi:very-short-patch-repair endonuclease
MPYELPHALSELAERQRGIVTRRQAMEAGLSRETISYRLRSGRWQQLHTGVYAVFSGKPDRQAILWAAVLRSGAGAMLSHQTAAELDGLVDTPAPSIHVSIPSSRRTPTVKGVVIHPRCDAQHVRHPAHLPPRTRIEDTILDLAGEARTSWDAVGWITKAVGRRLTTRDRLGKALARRPRFRWRSEVTIALSPDADGSHSALEYRYFRDVERPHHLPKARRQARVRRGDVTEYRDVLYDEFQLAVELDGLIAHQPEDRWRDVHRDNAAAADGLLTLRYGNRDVTVTPCVTAMEVGEVLKHRGWRGTLRPCSPNCSVGRPKQTRAAS